MGATFRNLIINRSKFTVMIVYDIIIIIIIYFWLFRNFVFSDINIWWLFFIFFQLLNKLSNFFPIIYRIFRRNFQRKMTSNRLLSFHSKSSYWIQNVKNETILNTGALTISVHLSFLMKFDNWDSYEWFIDEVNNIY